MIDPSLAACYTNIIQAGTELLTWYNAQPVISREASALELWHMKRMNEILLNYLQHRKEGSEEYWSVVRANYILKCDVFARIHYGQSWHALASIIYGHEYAESLRDEYHILSKEYPEVFRKYYTWQFNRKANKSKTFVIGDIHGTYRALLQCLERAGFNYEKDHLISLGDICDRGPDTKDCIDELLKIKNLTLVLGNHDFMALNWMETGTPDEVWLKKGGEATINSYGFEVPQHHISLLRNALPYYIQKNKLFVHAGIELNKKLHLQDTKVFLSDRTLATQVTKLFYNGNASQSTFTTFDEVYIGHTISPFFKPLQAGEVWMMDTGAGMKEGVLSMMNIVTKEIFSSDLIGDLYP
ncbi:metallophosphoesterase family protein [Chitinophaga sp. CF118]|uniref:metallophosphoesterase family protein n=1 Tax=Chitinophaga sp. CF118 TaxID=1884367 RepID=UPI001C431018|nr:metallophosphoesterase family protein [Chitinophaga sp. CF118]